MDHREQNRLANMLFERLKPSIISFADHRAAGVSASMNTGLDGLGYACFEVIAELAKELAPGRPIETAPKDGADILIYGSGCFSIARWVGSAWGLVADGDLIYNENCSVLTPHYPPSHWWALPEPPTTELQTR